MKKILKILLLMIFPITACMNDDDWYDLNSFDLPENSTGGLFIVNEGNFMYDNASLSYYDIDSFKIFNHVFYGKNEIPLGDVAQSMTINDSLGYIVLNNSGKIYVINTKTFEYAGKVTGLTSPRYIHFINNEKAYISDIYEKSISLLHPQSLNITGFISVNNSLSEFYQHPTEQMVQFGKYVFTNCWSYDNKILVINCETDRLVDSIEVIKQPVAMVLDKFSRLWVICDGGFKGSPFGQDTAGLVRIDALTRKVEKVYKFNIQDSPRDIAINGSGDTIYFINTHVYRHPVLSEANPELFIKSKYRSLNNGGYNCIGVDPNSSEVYLGDAIDNVQRGFVYRYRSSGFVLDSFNVGIIPGHFCFAH